MGQSFSESVTQPGSFLDPGAQGEPLTTPRGEPNVPVEEPHHVKETALTVPMWDPDRKGIVDVPKNYAQHLLATGYKYRDGTPLIAGEQAVQDEQANASVAGGAYLGAHNFLNTIMLGVPGLVEQGVLSEEGRERHRQRLESLRRNHPIVDTTTTLAGFLSPMGTASSLGMHAIEAGGQKLKSKALAELAELGATGKLAKAAEYGIKGVGALGSSGAALGADAAVRGAVDEATNEKSYSHPLEVDKIFLAGAKDFGWGLGTGAAFEGAFGALRGLRKVGSKAVDYVETKWPTKPFNVKGPKEMGPMEVKSKVVDWKKVGTKFGKTRGKETEGGGFESGSTLGRHRFDEDTLEQTKANSSFVTQDETLKETRHRTPDVVKQEKSWNEANPDAQKSTDEANGKAGIGGSLRRETGIVFKDGLKQEEYEAAVKQALDDLVEHNDFHKELNRYVMESEERIANHRAKKADLGYLDLPEIEDLAQAKKQKDAAQDYLRKRYPGDENTPSYQDWLDEYFNVKNGLHERITEKQAKVDPRFKVRKVKETFEKGHEESSFEHSHQNDFSSGEDQTSSKKHTVKKDYSEDKTAFNRKIKEKVTTTEGGKDEYEYKPFEKIRYAPSRVTRTEQRFVPTIRDGLRTPLMIAAGYAGWATGGVLGTTLAGTGLALDTAIPAALNNRAAVSKYFDSITKPVVKKSANLLKSYLRGKRDNNRADHNPVDVSQYPKAVSNATALSNPDVAAKKVTQAIEPVAHHYPDLHAHLIQKNIQAGQFIQPFIPRDTRAPALRTTPFEPSRSQKVKFLKMYNAITQPLEVMQNPSPTQMQVIEKHIPAHVDLLRAAVGGALVGNPKQISMRKQGPLSVVMGSNFTPRQDPKYLQRLQMTAHIDETQGKQGAGSSGPKSAKVTQDATTLYATPEQLHSIS